MFEAEQQRGGGAQPRLSAATATAVLDANTEFTALRLSMVNDEYTVCFTNERLPLVGFLMRVGASEQDAFDAAQDAFVEAYRCWERLTNPRAWLRTVALRHLPRRSEVPLDEQHDVPDYRPDALRIADETRSVLDALRRLPMAQRQVMA